MPQILYWKYRAYDQHESIDEGLHEGGSNHLEIILILRQNGLQVIDLVKISRQQYIALKRAKNLRGKIDIKEIPHHQTTYESQPLKIRLRKALFIILFVIMILSFVYAMLQ